MSSPDKQQQKPESMNKDTPVPESQDDSAGTEREIGGRKGPEPTRYGDWEKGGRCIDF